MEEAVRVLRAEEIDRVADTVIQAVEGDSAEGIPRAILDAIDRRRAKTHRLAVVGQIRFPEAPETPHTVVLGPFSCRGILDSREKFQAVLQKACADAREAGQGLAHDPKTKTGRGRFMLAPAFTSPRDAWEFYRQPAPPDPRLLRITETIRRWEAGKWAEEVSPKPACQCGLPEHPRHTSAGPAQLGPCPRHST